MKITLGVVQKRLIEIYPEATIVPDTFRGYKHKATFIDRDFGDWQALVYNVLRGTRHPKRAHESYIKPVGEVISIIQKKRPHIEMDVSSYRGTHKPARFIDPKYGEWWARPIEVMRGSGHPEGGHNRKLTPGEASCAVSKKHPDIRLDESTYTNTTTKAKFIDSHGEWWALPHNITHRDRDNVGHPDRPRLAPSGRGLEKFVSEWLQIDEYNAVPDFLRGVSQIRPDFKLSDDIFLETDGLFWHSELHREKWHHFRRREVFEEHGKRLLQFRENEIRNQGPIVKSIIENILGKTPNRVYARSCDIEEISGPEFFQVNHLMGYAPGKQIGLVVEGELLSLLSYKVLRGEMHIVRFANRLGYSVIGGFSKLLNHATRTFKGKIVNFVDLRYGTGKFLINLGFQLENITLGWSWTDGNRVFNRLKCRANMDPRCLSEREYANELRWFKIYDAGQAKYVCCRK